ncbi:hypothetical protein Leryth_017484 [Lithospermum erythrorhizon]|nr:hypothetical protein Leryth_017484 [Lithospermum erythrorhizon]
MLRNIQQSTLRQTSSRLLFLLFISLTNNHVHFVKAHIYMYAGCSQEKYQPNSPYETSFNSLLSSIVTSSSQTLYTSFTLQNDTESSPDSTIYGLYQCRGDLKPKDCSTCIAGAVSQIGLVCPYTYGATLQLDTCLVRYEHYDFLGTIDTSLRYEKCSKSGSADGEFLKRREIILNELTSTNVGFKVGVSGSVEGFSQCLGDLSNSDCEACISEAVEKLKTLCGSAKAGDMFLGQCYARYWASGYYDHESSSSQDPSSDNDVGKTVAIIVGVVVGVAVFIVFLSFCRKAIG